MNLFHLNADHYYRMTDSELEEEASKWKIRSYGNLNGTIERQIIIDGLLKKDQFNVSQVAVVISVVSLIISFFALMK